MDYTRTKQREIDEEELEKILHDHQIWLDSSGERGRRADLRNTSIKVKSLDFSKIDRNRPNAFLFDGIVISDKSLNQALCQGATLQGAIFINTDLSHVHFEGAILDGADFRHTPLGEAHFNGASLWTSDFRRSSYCQQVDFRKANLIGADFRGLNLSDSDFRGAKLMAANFDKADVTRIKYNRFGRYQGIRVENCYGNAHFKRLAQDQGYLEELRNRSWIGKLIYWAWLLLADCGRSLSVWTGWCLLIILTFAFFYTSNPSGFPQPMIDLIPTWWFNLSDYMGTKFQQTPISYQESPLSFWSACYFSVVTFTTLGFGDIVAANTAARVLVTIEVIIGYVMLGGLISILATKLARRS